MKPIKIGDYVLATKYSDGDPQDHWCIGFVKGFLEYPLGIRLDVCDENGNSFRGNGFRRARRITLERGKWLLNHREEIERYRKSLWGWLRIKMEKK